jgi:[acyl-carrier-protein] S-malonyltransferase
MKPAQERLKADLDAATFHDLTVPLINNWQAKEIHTAAEAREGLYQQVPNPVRWTDTVRYLGAQGVTHFTEIGPGTVLAGLVRTILPTATCQNISEPKHLEPA